VSDRLSPGPEAKARFQALGEKEYQAFFDEIPASAMRSVAKFLPSVDGFRKTSLAGITKQKTALARKLSRAGANDRDFNGLYLIWRTWIDANFENPKAIHEAMDKLEEAADKSSGNDARRLVVEQQTDIFLQKLKDESLHNHCTREQIERLFIFSPLPETPAARGLIAGAKNGVDVDRDATLSELPKRLQKDEDEIERIKSELKELSGRFDRALTSVENLPVGIAELHASIDEAKASAQKAQDAVEALAKVNRSLEGGPKTSAPDVAAIEIRIEALAIAVESRRGEIRTLRSKVEDVDTLLNAIAELEGAQKLIATNQHTQDQRIADMSEVMHHFKRELAERQLDPALAQQFGALEERVQGLEQRPTVSVQSLMPANETKALPSRGYEAPQHKPVGLRWDSLIASDAIGETSLQSHKELAHALAAALQSLGLRRSSAQVFGEECAAAVIAKQAIFLKGAFATQTARAFARAIGGTASVRIAMPIGLQDGEELRAAVESAFEAERLNLGAVVIEGINRTALDITKEVLFDCLNPGFDRAPSHSAVIATVSEGIASLPLELGYFEIGPVFDLNCLDWRTGQSSGKNEVPSAFSYDTHRALFAQIGSASVDADEAIRLASAFVSARNPSIERVFANAYRALHIVRTDIKAVTTIQSMFFGWLMPYWFALSITKEQIEIELDGGKVDGTAVDSRLTAMFKAANRSGGAT
jgi:hypothetical protein